MKWDEILVSRILLKQKNWLAQRGLPFVLQRHSNNTSIAVVVDGWYAPVTCKRTGGQRHPIAVVVDGGCDLQFSNSWRQQNMFTSRRKHVFISCIASKCNMWLHSAIKYINCTETQYCQGQAWQCSAAHTKNACEIRFVDFLHYLHVFI